MEYVNCAVTCRGRNERGFRVKHVRVHPSTDREWRANDLSIVCVHDDEKLGIAAPDKQSPVCPVHCHGYRLSGGGNRPARFDLERAGVNGDYFIRVFEIVVDHSLTIRDGLLWSAAERKGRQHLALRRIDNRAALGLTIEDEYALGHWLVQNRISIGLPFYLTCGLQCFHIKHDDLFCISVSDEPAAKLGDQGYSVVPL